VNIEQQVSAVIAYALKQHEDSEWDIVVSGMTRPEIARVLRTDGTRTRKQAIRAMRYHLELVKLGAVQPELVLA
jgi:hypothetical protein